MQNQKKADPKKGHYRISPLKNGLTKLPCFLKILASWGDFFDNGLLLYPVQDHTMQCCTRKPFWEAKREPQSFSASAFPYFEADAELGVIVLNCGVKSPVIVKKKLISLCQFWPNEMSSWEDDKINHYHLLLSLEIEDWGQSERRSCFVPRSSPFQYSIHPQLPSSPINI